VAVLRDQSRGSSSRGVALATGGVVVLQVVVTCVLLVGSLLQLRSIVEQQQVDFGYDTLGVLSARIGDGSAVRRARRAHAVLRPARHPEQLARLRRRPAGAPQPHLRFAG
jgi:hypothetical protein